MAGQVTLTTGSFLVTGSTTDSNCLYAAPDGEGIWENFVIHNHYEKDRKIYQLGITSPAGFAGQSVAFVQLAAPTLLWICDWAIIREGTAPIVPDPNPEVSSWVLLDDWWDTDPIQVADATAQIPSYAISGTYIYGNTNPANKTNQNIVYPIAPWINVNVITSDLRTVSDALLTKGLIDVLTGGALGSGVANGGGGTVGPGATGQGIVH